MNSEDLQQLKALAMAATRGRWRECGHERGGCVCGQIWSVEADLPIATAERGDEEIGVITPEFYKPNAAYIAAASPDVVLALIARIESLAADAERYKALRDTLRPTGGRYVPVVLLVNPIQGISLKDAIAGNDLDSAIDAATAKEKA